MELCSSLFSHFAILAAWKDLLTHYADFAILERNGYQVLTARNGLLGVQIVRDRKDDLDLVILDLTMPVMGGEQALAEMKSLAPDLLVVLSSGYDASQAISRVGENALAGFLQKPSTVAYFWKR